MYSTCKNTLPSIAAAGYFHYQSILLIDFAAASLKHSGQLWYCEIHKFPKSYSALSPNLKSTQFTAK